MKDIASNLQLFAMYAKGRYDKSLSSKQQNASSRRMERLATQMVQNGSIMELKDLLKHDDNAVKCHAAFYLLPFSESENEAKEVLKELAVQKGSIVFWEAERFLEDYKNGELNFPHCEKK